MIFSHAPLGFITTYIASKKHKEKLSKKQTFWIFLLGIIFSIFPDFDLFYYYFISASETHRALVTHTPFLYILISLSIFLVGVALKNKFYKFLSLIILLSSFSHLILDSLGSGIAWLYPFNNLPYGLLSISFLGEGLYGQNFFAVNYSIEAIILVIFFSMLVVLKYKKLRKIILITAPVFVIGLVSTLFYLNQHMFSINSNNYYADMDQDGVMNMKDLDMDGDSILNLQDDDANNNGKENINDLVKTAWRMEGVYYDRSEEGLYGLFSRFGFLSNIDIVYKPYDYSGMFLKSEIKNDFVENPTNYLGEPEKDYLFNDNVENLYTYCENKDFLHEDELKIGDMVFYEQDSKINHVSLLIEKPDIVLDAGIESKVIKTNIKNVSRQFGDINYYCRILN